MTAPNIRSYMQFFSRFGLTWLRKVNFSTFSGQLTFQSTRNGPQNLPFCPGSLQDTFIIFSRYLTNIFPKIFSKKYIKYASFCFGCFFRFFWGEHVNSCCDTFGSAGQGVLWCGSTKRRNWGGLPAPPSLPGFTWGGCRPPTPPQYVGRWPLVFSDV